MNIESQWAAIAVDAIAEMVVVIDGLGTVVYANDRAEQLLGVRREDWLGRPGFDIIHPDELPMAAELIVSAQATGTGVKEPVTYRFRRGDGTWLQVELIASGVVHDGRPHLVLSGRPAWASRPHAEILGEIAGRLSCMFDDAAIGIAQVSLRGDFIRVNPRLAADLGVPALELCTRSVFDLLRPGSIDQFAQAWWNLLEGEIQVLSAETSFFGSAGVLHAIVSGSIVTDRNGVPLYVALQMIDVTGRVMAEESLRRSEELLRAAQIELRHQSTHDRLTGLGNRTLMEEVLDRLQHQGVEDLAVVYVDLDGFKAVNDAHGHAVGDQLLVHASERLRTAARATDTLIRMGGDEFVVIAQSIGAGEAESMAKRLVLALGQPFVIDGVEVQVSASAGLAAARGPVDDIPLLVAEADRALYRAKRNGRSQIAAIEIASNIDLIG
ncbi:MAG: diguanylate cyclase/phosphodiesterase with sensor(s) [Ilumatobacteraceae bacterium]|nr:diguanylate cyclase/phosphodiesterase with sensor(s) [Ilumatobacteraceae bacterium]